MQFFINIKLILISQFEKNLLRYTFLHVNAAGNALR